MVAWTMPEVVRSSYILGAFNERIYYLLVDWIGVRWVLMDSKFVEQTEKKEFTCSGQSFGVIRDSQFMGIRTSDQSSFLRCFPHLSPRASLTEHSASQSSHLPDLSLMVHIFFP